MTDYDYRIVGIDPGSHTLGYAVITVDIRTGAIVNVTATPVQVHKLGVQDSDVVRGFGARASNTLALAKWLPYLFRTDQPAAIVYEQPFYMAAKPSAFAPLAELIKIIKDAIVTYDFGVTRIACSPKEAKVSVGVVSDFGNKESVRAAVINLGLPYTSSPSLGLLDPNAVDAIAVAYYGYLMLQNHFKALRGATQCN